MAETTTFGRKIRHLRQLRGITLTQLAEITGHSLSYLSEIESGKRKQPRKDVLLELSKALNVDPKFLLDDEAVSVFEAFDVAKEDMPEDIKEFLMHQDSLPWIHLAKECNLQDITADEVRELLKVIKRFKNGELNH
jgi:transcriptional regulator with XRE-family HTH domain